MKRGVLAAAVMLGALSTPWAFPQEVLKLSDDEQKLLELINDERKKVDLPPLKPDPLLFKAARDHAANMARQGKMKHELDSKSPFDRIKSTGYRYTIAGENIACGDDTLAAVVKRWMESMPHKENILGRRYVETGLGLAKDEKGDIFYAQVFAAPRK
jgi:uncharacterized protein YkwD